MPFDHLLPVKVPPSPRKADEVGVHYHRGLRPKWTELVGLEGSLQRFQKEESLNWRGTKRSSNTIIMIFWPLAFMLLVVHYTNYVPEKERIKGKWSTVFENFQKCLIFLQTLLPPKIKFLELFKYLILGELVFNCLACKDVKLSHFMQRFEWDFFEWFSNTMHGNEPYLETSRRHQTYLFSNKHRRSWRQKNTYSSDTQ